MHHCTFCSSHSRGSSWSEYLNNMPRVAAPWHSILCPLSVSSRRSSEELEKLKWKNKRVQLKRLHALRTVQYPCHGDIPCTFANYHVMALERSKERREAGSAD